jgi:hypothetical protein
MQFTKPIPFKEAQAKLGKRSVIASQLTSDDWKRVPVALRERAFFSSQIENVQFLQRTKDLLGDFLTGAREEVDLPDGSKSTMLKTGGRAAFVDQARAFALSQGMGPLVPEDAGTIKDIRSEQRLNLIFDTQTHAANAFGAWKQGQDPAVLDEFPAQRFIREREVKEPRDFHHSHEGEVQLKSDLGFWRTLNQDFGVPWGPWGWGCGHDVEDVDRAEAERLGLLAPGTPVAPVVADFNDQLKASVANVDPDLQAWLKERLGDRLKWDGNAVWWVGLPID